MTMRKLAILFFGIYFIHFVKVYANLPDGVWGTVRSGDLPKLEKLVSEGLDLNEHGLSLLEIAALYNRDDIVVYLIPKVDHIVTKDDNYTSLYNGIGGGNKTFIEYLIPKISDVNAKDHYRYPPLYYAVKSTNSEIVQIFIDHGADINVIIEQPDYHSNEIKNYTYLMLAAEHDKLDIVETLIKNGINDINARSKQAETALFIASELGNSTVVQALLDHGADPNIRGFGGRTALLAASEKNHIETVRILVENGANVNAQDNWADTPLSVAVNNDFTEIKEILKNHGASIATPDAGNRTIVFSTTVKGSFDPDVDKKREKAKKLEEEAMNYYMQGNVKKSIILFEEAADLGNAEAQNALGEIYYYGSGVRKDYRKAFFWLQKAAEQGVAAAQVNLGVLYEGGLSVEQNFDKALFWYQKAAYQNYPIGQGNLGMAFLCGMGVEKDEEKAVYWLEKAAAQGFEPARERAEVIKAGQWRGCFR